MSSADIVALIEEQLRDVADDPDDTPDKVAAAMVAERRVNKLSRSWRVRRWWTGLRERWRDSGVRARFAQLYGDALLTISTREAVISDLRTLLAQRDHLIAGLEHQIKERDSTLLVQAKEIEMLALVNQRNYERVAAETAEAVRRKEMALTGHARTEE